MSVTALCVEAGETYTKWSHAGLDVSHPTGIDEHYEMVQYPVLGAWSGHIQKGGVAIATYVEFLLDSSSVGTSPKPVSSVGEMKPKRLPKKSIGERGLSEES